MVIYDIEFFCYFCNTSFFLSPYLYIILCFIVLDPFFHFFIICSIAENSQVQTNADNVNFFYPLFFLYESIFFLENLLHFKLALECHKF